MTLPRWDIERSNYPAAQNNTYLMTAAAGPLSNSVHHRFLTHLNQLHERGDVNWVGTMDEIEECRQRTAHFIGAQSSEEIAFTGNTSLAMNLLAMTFKQILLRQDKPLSLLSCKEEFPSTTLPWLHHGFELTQVPAQELEHHLKNLRHSVVAVSAVQYGTGFRQNLTRLGQLCSGKSFFIVNATQSLGAFPVDVKEAQVSALTASCHKWMGCGFGLSVLYFDHRFHRDSHWPLAGWLGMNEPMLMVNQQVHLKGTAQSFELGVPPIANILALDTQIKEIQRIGIHHISSRILEISGYLVTQVKSKLPWLKLISHRTPEKDLSSPNSGILLFTTSRAEECVNYLAQNKVYVSLRQGGLRVATHFFNSHQDIDRLVSCLEDFYHSVS